MIPVLMLIVGWIGFLGSNALQVNYNLSWRRSVAASLAPAMILFLPAALIFSILSIFFMGFAFIATQILSHLPGLAS